MIRQPTEIGENLIDHLWGRLGWQSLILHLFIFPIPPSLITSSVGGGVTALVSDGLGVRPLPLEDVLPRPLPRPLAAVLPRATAPVAGSVVSCLAGVGVGVVVALVLTICEKRVKMVRYQFVSPRYHLDPSNSTNEGKKEWNFPKVL